MACLKLILFNTVAITNRLQYFVQNIQSVCQHLAIAGTLVISTITVGILYTRNKEIFWEPPRQDVCG